MKKYSFSLWWIKRDFRLVDNHALTEALRLSQWVLPLYIFEPSITGAVDYSDFHRHAVSSALLELRQRVRELGGDVWVGESEVEIVIAELERLVRIDAIFSHEETGASFTYDRDRRIKNVLRDREIAWRELPTNGVFRALKDRNRRSLLWGQRMAEPIVGAPKAISLPSQVKVACEGVWKRISQGLSANIRRSKLELVSEGEAERRLQTFLSVRGVNYSGGISSPNSAFESGSRLSAQLAWGTISLRRVVAEKDRRRAELVGSRGGEATQWRRSLNAFSSRLHWHDHFIQRLESEANMEFLCLNPVFENLPYRFDAERIQRWLGGETGVPMVDACMRCLQETGFLNFRMRAMVVSYACHVLHLSWKNIMYPLAKLFLDYEPGIHISQLQMQAGVVGINTLRVYSPDKQMVDQDPDLVFIRKWIPELRKVSKEEVYNYLRSSIVGYPKPMVDYLQASSEMKRAVYSLKRSHLGQEESKRVLEKHGSRKGRKAKPKVSSQQLSLFGDLIE